MNRLDYGDQDTKEIGMKKTFVDRAGQVWTGGIETYVIVRSRCRGRDGGTVHDLLIVDDSCDEEDANYRLVVQGMVRPHTAGTLTEVVEPDDITFENDMVRLA